MTKPTAAVERLHEELSGDLDRIKARFKNARVTLVVRTPETPEGGVVIGDDDLELAVKEIRKLQERAGYVVESPRRFWG